MEAIPSSRSASDRLAALPTLGAGEAWDWDAALGPASASALEAALAKVIPARRWFGAKARTIRALRLIDALAVTPESRLVLVRVEYTQGPDEVYQIPLGFAAGVQAERLISAMPASLWARVQLAGHDEPALLYDPLGDPAFCQALLGLFDRQSSAPLGHGQLVVQRTGAFAAVRGDAQGPLPARLLQVEQSNSTIVYGERLALKLFRRVELGLNPDLEINAHLTRYGFAHAPRLAGSLEYRPAGQAGWGLAMLQEFVANQGDAWQYTLNWLTDFLRQSTTCSAEASGVCPTNSDSICAAASRPIPKTAASLLAGFLPRAELLGKRTAEMHLTLAAATNEPAFAPEPLASSGLQSFAQQAQRLTSETYQQLRDRLSYLPEKAARLASAVLPLEAAAQESWRRFAAENIEALKIRCHGDYHLGQVLVTANDFMIIDFEGEPARSLVERQKKQSPLRDVAGMIRSFHYASCAAAQAAKANRSAADAARIEPWAEAWYFWTSTAFLASYQATASSAGLLPKSQRDLQRLLDAYLLEKALYELRYELNHRPDWVPLPLQALKDLLEKSA